MEPRKPIQHRMTRRAAAHDYTRPGIYHITLHVAEALGQPLGTVMGNLDAPDSSPDAPRTVLTPIGQMVEQQLLTAIHGHYSMISIQDYVIMPEHLHFLAEVQDFIISKNGKRLPLGQVIAGFKKGCNRHYWEITGQTNCGGKTAAHRVSSGFPAGKGIPAGYKVPSNASSGRKPLFDEGFCDVMPVDAAQLATQRAYIAGNPRSRLLRSTQRAVLTVQHGGIDTALTPSALHGYLKRECGAALTDEVWQAIDGQLLKAPDGTVACDSFGDRRLLSQHFLPSAPSLLSQHRLLPVVCHRKDQARFGEQKARCLEAAAQGAVLVSACISPREREIITECVNHGFPVITIHDNGFADRYHPSADRLDLCAAGRLLLVTPWQYQYRHKEEAVTVPFCKTMNCVVQALCHKKDNWWKNQKRMNR